MEYLFKKLSDDLVAHWDGQLVLITYVTTGLGVILEPAEQVKLAELFEEIVKQKT